MIQPDANKGNSWLLHRVLLDFSDITHAWCCKRKNVAAMKKPTPIQAVTVLPQMLCQRWKCIVTVVYGSQSEPLGAIYSNSKNVEPSENAIFPKRTQLCMTALTGLHTTLCASAHWIKLSQEALRKAGDVMEPFKKGSDNHYLALTTSCLGCRLWGCARKFLLFQAILKSTLWSSVTAVYLICNMHVAAYWNKGSSISTTACIRKPSHSM